MAAGNYFKNFRFAEYKFGDNTDIDLFNNITQYVDLIDQVRNNISFTEKYNILSGDRPDVVSHKLYGTMDYYWTFYLMNEHVRLSGWPLNNDEILDQVKSKYPNRVLTTTSEIGASATFFSSSKVCVSDRIKLSFVLISSIFTNPPPLFKFNSLNTPDDKFIICVDEYAPLLLTLTFVVLPFSKFVTSSIDGNGSDLWDPENASL